MRPIAASRGQPKLHPGCSAASRLAAALYAASAAVGMLRSPAVSARLATSWLPDTTGAPLAAWSASGTSELRQPLPSPSIALGAPPAGRLDGVEAYWIGVR